jgi:hypothetical protein
LLINAEQIFAVGRVIKQTASQWGWDFFMKDNETVLKYFPSCLSLSLVDTKL